MMSPDLNAGGVSGEQTQGQRNSNWWVLRWSSWLATLGAVILAFCGLMTAAFSAITLSICVISGVLQIFASLIILSIEGSAVVSFLTFAKPVGVFFENKPVWIKTAVYGFLTVFPMMMGCSGIWLTLGFIISLGITALYGMMLIGEKAEVDDMRAAATLPV